MSYRLIGEHVLIISWVYEYLMSWIWLQQISKEFNILVDDIPAGNLSRHIKAVVML